jgi:hypothetical protein
MTEIDARPRINTEIKASTNSMQDGNPQFSVALARIEPLAVDEIPEESGVAPPSSHHNEHLEFSIMRFRETEVLVHDGNPEIDVVRLLAQDADA